MTIALSRRTFLHTGAAGLALAPSAEPATAEQSATQPTAAPAADAISDRCIDVAISLFSLSGR